jgi:hypothetical protein
MNWDEFLPAYTPELNPVQGNGWRCQRCLRLSVRRAEAWREPLGFLPV